ncbi:MAG: phage holin family protein [Dysgonamonadaceae bacterium]|jgi:hypothetical protein|nr:phage holin family protein [Dysgonamonadaceae bacterium]
MALYAMTIQSFLNESELLNFAIKLFNMLLFIPTILEGDWPTLTVKCCIVVGFWILVVFAVLIDLWTGLERAKVLKEKPQSHKYRRTIEKIGEYWRILAFGLMFDVIASPLPFYTLPYASMFASVACIAIELKSVIENLNRKKSAAAKIPEIIAELIATTDRDKVAELLKNYSELGKKDKENGRC